ncbi:MAG: exopolysaccharide biosynthesis polyprenyl glycosylphosphotransferase [Fervidobacterium sp.]|uniref:exopolysaccharide biosynthesis polyprenyl glycosylphosphotransferase n=1 Tax=Fervidobacterium sp. TaxID=1871331 RepID=UPI0025BADED8|nr:exopolysaccharide biosynthesis polyprenyl glycosylphosphotransferase [Fervidobacterium sp.]NPU89513.1 exopolysaccharide biosynthesis polyprenyl glycosylphosphotransferase [Fervidobacterium sp.]
MNLLILLNYILIVFSSVLLTERILQSFVYSVVIICALYAFRFYEYIDDLRESIIRSIVGILSGSLFILLVCKLFKDSYCSWKLALLMVALAVVFPVVNYIFAKTLQKNRNTIKYLVVGNREELFTLLKEIEEKSKGRYRFVDYINPSPVVFKEKVKHFDNIIIADPKLEGKIQEELEQIKQTHKIEYLPNLVEKVLKRIPLEVMQKFEEYYKVYFDNIEESPAKRVMDIFFSLIGLVVYSPVILISAIFIMIEDGWPVIFKQIRVGKDGKEYWMIKLRSMRKQKTDGPKFADDEKHRILKIGRFIRPTRIDESLQFVDVLKGQMSIVGPRPEQVPFVRMFEQQIPYYSLRHKVKPGITGWAQICYQYSSSVEETAIKLSYDLYYVKNRTVFMDLKILLLTLETLIFRRGAK